MSYYDYLCDTCNQLNARVESLHFAEAYTSDVILADNLATKADRLSDISDSIWDKACSAARHDA